MTSFPLNTAGAHYDVTGIGNAIVDVLFRVDEAFLVAEKMRKGTMELIDEARAEHLYGQSGQASLASGGSVANSVAAVASLGGRACFMGHVKDDAFGGVYREDMRRIGVAFDTPAAMSGPATGRCYIAITPDGERTMNTYLGASTEFTLADVDTRAVASSTVTYLEGYLWNQADADAIVLKAANAARDAGRHVAFTLSDLFCIELKRDNFLSFLPHANIVFGNAVEAKALAANDDLDAAVDWLGERVSLAVITDGPSGALVRFAGQTLRIPATRVETVVDQTGAGDLFAAGFLHALTQGKPLEECAALGHACAGEIIQQLGARAQRPLSRLAA